MSTTAPQRQPASRSRGLACPFDLRVDTVARFLNCEIADHPVYDGLELQAFDDAEHGAGMLAFLTRRADGLVDYYVEPSLRLDRSSYQIGAGTGVWVEQVFAAARLAVEEDGVDADVAFHDREGRLIEVRVDDRDGRPRRRGRLLAPVGAGIEQPRSLLLVLLGRFDLLRRTKRAPVVRIDGQQVATGHLPGAVLHRRHLIKYASELAVVSFNSVQEGSARVVDADDAGAVELSADGTAITALRATAGAHQAVLRLDPPLPDLRTIREWEPLRGTWQIDVDDTAAITGGVLTAARADDDVVVFLDVTRRWRPRRLPLLMKLVTAIIPTFRRWPTTYRWAATVHLGEGLTLRARWRRTETGTGEAYRRRTGSA